jgi:antitoxin component of RelBE/YafQ-DinJ toxin-antitoxin module
MAMNTKLTLRLDDHLIESAKEYSAKTGKSVSRIVADLFEIIKNEKLRKDAPLSPTVRSLRGVLKGKKVNENDYKKYLKEKYS